MKNHKLKESLRRPEEIVDHLQEAAIATEAQDPHDDEDPRDDDLSSEEDSDSESDECFSSYEEDLHQGLQREEVPKTIFIFCRGRNW